MSQEKVLRTTKVPQEKVSRTTEVPQEKVSRTTEVRKRRYHAQDKIEKVSRIVGREIFSRLLGREDIAHKDRKDMTL